MFAGEKKEGKESETHSVVYGWLDTFFTLISLTAKFNAGILAFCLWICNWIRRNGIHNDIYLARFLLRFLGFFCLFVGLIFGFLGFCVCWVFLVHYSHRTAQYFVQVCMSLSQKTSIISILISMDLIKEKATGVKGRNSQLFSSFDSWL